jgi:hypothetical protein
MVQGEAMTVDNPYQYRAVMLEMRSPSKTITCAFVTAMPGGGGAVEMSLVYAKGPGQNKIAK